MVEMSAVWCFQCGNEYVEGVEQCVECGVPTTPERPTDVQAVGDASESQLAYDLHEWSGQGRRILDGMLTTSGIQHAWQGATLVVREADEEAIDNAVREAEVAAMPTLPEDAVTMVYELDEFSDEARTRLTNNLGLAGIAHAFDGNSDLVVLENDEEKVDAVFEALDTVDPEEYTFGPGVPGVAAHEVLSNLLISASTLRRNPGDTKAAKAFIDDSLLSEELELPFGFSSPDWRGILDTNMALRSVLQSPGEYENDEIDEFINASFSALRPIV